ncbi:MAG: hypothetical protein UMV23_03700 [Halanaerobium sp.]|nr:hypothetical protein [Halanaerobium sp.]
MLQKVGVDIDGVLTDERDQPWQRAIEEFFSLDGPVNQEAYDFREVYDLTDEQLWNFYSRQGEQVFRNLDPWVEARDTLCYLKEEGIEISMVTARPPDFFQITAEWLEQHRIPYDNLVHDRNKAPVCQRLQVELFVEDNLENALAIADCGIKVFLIDKHYNRSCEEGLIRVNDWQEVRMNLDDILGKG